MHLLVVDPNLAFATLLTEELKRLDYDVSTAASGTEALAHARRRTPTLVFLDMALAEPGAITLAHQLRAIDPNVRLVLIPMIGEDPVLSEDAPAIQGVLPKPFFLPELPDRIDAAMSASMDIDQSALQSHPDPGDVEVDETAVVASFPTDVDTVMTPDRLVDAGSHSHARSAGGNGKDAVSGEWTSAPAARSMQTLSRAAVRANHSRIEHLLRELVAEVGADAVLLTGEDGVLMWVGSLDEVEIHSISEVVMSSRETSVQMARILGREQLRFEQSIAGGSYMLYALSIHDAILAVTVSGSAALGLLRHRARSIGEHIADLCGTGQAFMT